MERIVAIVPTTTRRTGAQECLFMPVHMPVPLGNHDENRIVREPFFTERTEVSALREPVGHSAAIGNNIGT